MRQLAIGPFACAPDQSTLVDLRIASRDSQIRSQHGDHSAKKSGNELGNLVVIGVIAPIDQRQEHLMAQRADIVTPFLAQGARDFEKDFLLPIGGVPGLISGEESS